MGKQERSRKPGSQEKIWKAGRQEKRLKNEAGKLRKI
jgi:hypothetical protein